MAVDRPTTEAKTSAKTVVGLFETVHEADRAAAELMQEGFPKEQIGIISGHDLSQPGQHITAPEDSEGKVLDAVGKGLAMGGGLGAVAGIVSSLLVPAVGPLFFGGALASTFLGAGLGASVGGVMAGLMKAGVDESDARLFEAGLRHGGVVLTVHTDDKHCRNAVAILDRNGALDMDEHRQRFGDPGTDSVEGSIDGRGNDTHRAHSSADPGRLTSGETVEAMAQEENARRLEPWAKHGAILGGNTPADAYDDEFHRDYQNRYAGTGVGYDRYQPAYSMGAQYARDSRYHDRDWSTIEPEVRRDWESRHHGSWDQFGDAVRHGWHRARGDK